MVQPGTAEHATGSSAAGATTNPAQVIAQQQQRIQELMAAVKTLQEQTVQPGTMMVTSTAKVPLPPRFDGSREDLKPFLTGMETYCRFNRQAFPNDQDKIIMAASDMKGKASVWIQPLVDDYMDNEDDRSGCRDDTKRVFKTWESFKREIRIVFGEVDEAKAAVRKLRNLKQTKSASEYTAEFKQIQSQLEWDDAALMEYYYEGLKDHVKDEIARNEWPGDLGKFIETAVRIDNRLYERAQEKKKRGGIPFSMRKGRDHRSYDRMDIDRVEQKPWKGQRPRNGISNKERQKRYENKACLGCGEIGHFVRECPRGQERNSGKGQTKAVKIAMVKQKYKEELYDDEWENDIATELEQTLSRMGSQTVKTRLDEGRCWICGDDQHLGKDCWANYWEERVATGPEMQALLRKVAEVQYGIEKPALQTNFLGNIRLGRDLLPIKDEEIPKEQLVTPEELEVSDLELDRSEDEAEIDEEPEPQPVLYVTDLEVYRRLAEGQCWICGSETHLGSTCRWNTHTVHIAGPQGAKAAHQADWVQHDSKGTLVTETNQTDWRSEEHQTLDWDQCETGCRFHRGKKRTTGWRQDHHLHKLLAVHECFVGWGCKEHGQAMKAQHQALPASQCILQHCPVFGHSPEAKEHEHLMSTWTQCYEDKCEIHQQMKKFADWYPKGPEDSKN
jgi:hypothetical protein